MKGGIEYPGWFFQCLQEGPPKVHFWSSHKRHQIWVHRLLATIVVGVCHSQEVPGGVAVKFPTIIGKLQFSALVKGKREESKQNKENQTKARKSEEKRKTLKNYIFKTKEIGKIPPTPSTYTNPPQEFPSICLRLEMLSASYPGNGSRFLRRAIFSRSVRHRGAFKRAFADLDSSVQMCPSVIFGTFPFFDGMFRIVLFSGVRKRGHLKSLSFFFSLFCPFSFVFPCFLGEIQKGTGGRGQKWS